ncbi:hypothetical protein PtA15_8A21 [Puccinia triticina]|uniref:Secreted protein n=1 Tax=Puccinia triticina TaxID=208348 RepID=A0ABY7CR09_9BASI|nr:uncharacterized protein PtA15_8A21 [Puccinia triticina]WAQ87120.1 hypothetical protein PtA15_8A21 [Puccinia triticina]WAR56979.1 hypothetical protein PtB15_8B23 [Puccinia triticina]
MRHFGSNFLVVSLFLAQAHGYQYQPRDLSSTDTALPATVSGVSTGFVSGQKAVTAQLKADAHAAIQDFSAAITSASGNSTTQSSAETAQLFTTIVKGAMAAPINQNIGLSDTPSQDRLNSMASTINATLNSINDAANSILSKSNGALHYQDLKDCIGGMVQQGGLHDGESCVMNGMSITGVSNIMTNVLKNFGNNAIPPAVIHETTKALDPSFTAIIPGEKTFYDSVNNAITSVQASVSGQLIAALNDAQNCFETAMKSDGTYEQKMQLTQECNRSPKGKSVYNDLKTLYLSVTNQFVGYLQPNVIDSVHDIADHYLDKNDTSSDEAYFRQAVRNTTSSLVASNAGNQVTYAYNLADCLDSVIGTTDPHAASNIANTKDCLTKPDGAPASVKQIVYGYIQQIYGVLPPQLAAKIEASGVGKLDPADPQYQSKVAALHVTFEKTDVGPQYVTCYEAFVDCLFNERNGALEKPGNTQSVCLLGDACQKAPDGKDNLAVPFGRRSLKSSYAEHLLRRLSMVPTKTTTPTQKARIVRKYTITLPHRSYLLNSFHSNSSSL